MSSGHRTAVVVHSPPLSARAIKAVCDCTLGAVNVKAAPGRKKEKRRRRSRSGQVRKGGTEPPLRSESPRRSYSRKPLGEMELRDSESLWWPVDRRGAAWGEAALNDKWQNNSSPSDTPREQHGQPGWGGSRRGGCRVGEKSQFSPERRLPGCAREGEEGVDGF